MSTPTISTLSLGRSIVSSVIEENVQAVCDHVKETDDLLLVENAFGPEIEGKIKQNGLKTGSLQSKGTMYRIICKEEEQ